MLRYLPVCLNLTGKAVLLVGGGSVSESRVDELLECGARLTVISPEARPAIRGAAARGALRWLARRFEPGDTAGHWLVLAATDEPETNAAVFAEAERAGLLVNSCDDPPHCNLIFASQVRRGPLTVSIFSQGLSPALSRRVRRELEQWLGPEYGELAELMARVRRRVSTWPGLSQPGRQAVYERLVYSDLLLVLREGGAAAGCRRAGELLREEMERLGLAGAVEEIPEEGP